MQEPSTPEPTAPSPPDFFRKHTFLEKGPNRREVRDHLASQAIVLPHQKGRAPLSSHQMMKFFIEQRRERFPDQFAQNAVTAHRNAEKVRRRVDRRNAARANQITVGPVINSGTPDPTCFVYVLRSSVTDKLYTGTTNDLVKRLSLHNAGKGAKATRAGRPWTMVYSSKFDTRGEALSEEARIKKLTRAEKLVLVSQST